MKRFVTLMLMAFLASAFEAQAAERMWAIIDYMHIPDGKSDSDYIALEKLWQKIHQKAADAGICRAWYLDRVENGGRNDFVTIRIYDSLAKATDPWPESLMKGAFNAQEEAALAKTEEVRQLTRSELWEVEASIMQRKEFGAHGFDVVNFMKVNPGKGNVYYNLEKDIFQKFHKARVDNGEMEGWVFSSRSFPNGYDSEYDFITVDLYADKAASEKPWDNKLAERALTKDEIEKAQKVDTTRSIVRREIWHPVLQVFPKN